MTYKLKLEVRVLLHHLSQIMKYKLSIVAEVSLSRNKLSCIKVLLNLFNLLNIDCIHDCYDLLYLYNLWFRLAAKKYSQQSKKNCYYCDSYPEASL